MSIVITNEALTELCITIFMTPFKSFMNADVHNKLMLYFSDAMHVTNSFFQANLR